MEKSMMDAQNAAQNAARRAGPVHGYGNAAAPLLIEQSAGFNPGMNMMPGPVPMGMPPGIPMPPMQNFAAPNQFGPGRP